jgi:hypothetical protein
MVSVGHRRGLGRAVVAMTMIVLRGDASTEDADHECQGKNRGDEDSDSIHGM